MIGIVDTFLYMTSFLIGYPEFIMVWLAFKITGRWSYVSKSKDELSVFNREFYNIFVLGNALTIIYSILCAIVIKRLVECINIWFEVVLIGVGVLILSIILYFYISKKTGESVKSN